MNASALEAILYLAIQAPDNYLAIQSFYCLLSNQLTNEFFWRNIDILVGDEHVLYSCEWYSLLLLCTIIVMSQWAWFPH
jgi:hypothetical protein